MNLPISGIDFIKLQIKWALSWIWSAFTPNGLELWLKYKSKCFQLLNFDHLEVVVVKIKINTFTLYIFWIYILYGSLFNVYDSVISALYTFFETSNICDSDLFILLGDFNLQNCNWVSHCDFPNVYVLLTLLFSVLKILMLI